MVARINTPSSINRALNYNEQKVQNGQAVLLHAEGFLKDAEQLNFHDKLNRFKHLIELNGRAKTNSLHISLNFDNSDTLTNEKVVEIAQVYMDKIGFANQPYLVYRHNDAGHPHIHIVTTSIRSDGCRIDTFNIGRIKSEPARKEIEEDFNLRKASQGQQTSNDIKSAYTQKAQYGKTETKKAIQNVLIRVVNSYKYSSLPELNAVLQQYNVIAERGSENSRVYKHNGLVYRLLDEQGNKVGIPIKASVFYSKPTLATLQQRFNKNEADRQPFKTRVKNAVDLALLKQPQMPVETLINALEKSGIATVLRRNNEGVLYGITYVDHQSKCVFNGSDLGKAYSAKAIQERCGLSILPGNENTREKKNMSVNSGRNNGDNHEQKLASLNLAPTEFTSVLMHAENDVNYVPAQLKRKRKKSKKKGTSDHI